MPYIDLTEPVNSYHWRYPNYVRTLEFLKRNSKIKSPFLSLDRGFTHLLAPSSMIPGGKTLDDYNLFDTLINRAAVLHLEDAACDNGEITKEQVAAAYAKCEPAPILLLATGFGRVHDSYTHDYWDKAPHLSAEAAEYLRDLQPVAVGFDFAEDPGMCLDPRNRYKPENNPAHRILLESGILMLEYLNFLWKVPVNNVDFYALPLHIHVDRFDYGSVRAVVKF